MILYGCASHESAAQVEPPKSFPREQIAKGEELAHIGNCLSCHTAEGGKPYAGGTPLKTPFGTIYGTNITPDAETGIGGWSLVAFTRAMREGVDREGRHLFPAFPYDHFTKLTDEDVAALYAFIMTREPVSQENRRNSVPLPRASVGIWKSRYFERGVYKPDPARSAEWNRGAYLVEGLAHCGACHTPRNALGAEKLSDAYGGGEAERWLAPAMNEASPAPVPWTADDVFNYLRYGFDARHGIAAGPMVDVVRNLARVPESDVRAIAVYMADRMRRPTREANPNDELNAFAALDRARTTVAVQGNSVYDGACADCHNRGREQEGGALQLPLGTALTIPTPRNLAYIIRDGIVPREGERGGWMPGYAGAFTDEQMADLLTYLRALSGQPAWRDVAGEVRKLSKEQR